MTQNILLTLTNVTEDIPFLLGTTTAGENEAKLLAICLGLIALAIFISSRIFQEMAVRVGLPPVLGDLIAGLAIGISGLHLLALEGGEVNQSLIHFIELISGSTPEQIQGVFAGPVRIIIENNAEFGVGVLLFLIGLESDLKELLKVGVQSAFVAVSGVTLPFILGFLGLVYIFHVPTLPALFAGAALTATSIGITAKVMQDMGVLKSKEGQIILGAAILDDILGIVILAVVISIVETGQIDVVNAVKLILTAAAFMIAAVVMNRFFGPWFITQLDKFKAPSTAGMGSFILFIALSLLAGLVGLESILGAFATGLILGGTSKRDDLIEGVGVLSFIFSTIFFVSIGAKTDLSVLNPSIPANREGLIVAIFLIIVAIVGKVGAGFFAFSSDKINRLAVGTGMIPRGEVGLVFAGLGSATGALPPSIDVAIVLMVIATTFLAPPLLRVVFPTSESVPLLVPSDPSENPS